MNNKFIKEVIILLMQLALFYVIPLFAGPTDIMGMVLLIILLTLLLSIIIGIISKDKLKYLYPIVVSILFIPSVFIYYNESALIHALWYFIISMIGLTIGSLLCKIFKNNNTK